MLFRSLGFVTLGIIFVRANLVDWHISTICTKSGKGQNQNDNEKGSSTSTGHDSSGGSLGPNNGSQTGSVSHVTTEPGIKDIIRIPSGRYGVLWEEGIIPYYFNTHYYGPVAETLFEKAISEIESASCLRFQKLTKAVLTSNFKRNWLHIANENGQRFCSHFDVNAQQNYYEIAVVLGYDCLKSSEILHTLLHGVGLADEITHPKRDRYVAVMWDNIQHNYHKLFRKAHDASYNMKVEYDPQSIMHFHDHAFTRQGRPTVIPLKPGVHIAPSEHLSQLDQVKLSIIGAPQCGQIAYGQVKQRCELGSDVPKFTNADPSQDSDSEDEPQKMTREEHGVKQTAGIDETKANHMVEETKADTAVTEQEPSLEHGTEALHGAVAEDGTGIVAEKKHLRKLARAFDPVFK